MNIGNKMSNIEVSQHIVMNIVLVILCVGSLLTYPWFLHKFKKPVGMVRWLLLVCSLGFSALFMFLYGLGAGGYLD